MKVRRELAKASFASSLLFVARAALFERSIGLFPSRWEAGLGRLLERWG